ncbi:hypothetical protein ACH5RR_008406 [Cinchona calisaya]|uniref:Uncharacterized protein n=1 Tax=Cinchona calisaya TaxID=153742 RepID=A0ABD3AD20_9GENT
MTKKTRSPEKKLNFTIRVLTRQAVRASTDSLSSYANDERTTMQHLGRCPLVFYLKIQKLIPEHKIYSLIFLEPIVYYLKLKKFWLKIGISLCHYNLNNKIWII